MSAQLLGNALSGPSDHAQSTPRFASDYTFGQPAISCCEAGRRRAYPLARRRSRSQAGTDEGSSRNFLEEPERLRAGEQHRLARAPLADVDLDHEAALHALVVRMDILDLTVEDGLHRADLATPHQAPRAAVQRTADAHVLEVLVGHEHERHLVLDRLQVRRLREPVDHRVLVLDAALEIV